MYLPAHFAAPSPDALHALIRAHPLATVILAAADAPDADHIPLHLHLPPDGPALLRGHVARANPLWRRLADAPRALAVFHGPSAYVSPDWYPSKHAHHRAVPTWNYAVAHAHGRLRAIDDAGWLRDFLAGLTADHEAARPRPWALGDAPADYLEKMLAAVVGIELTVERLTGKFKLSQNRPAEDRAGVAAGLRAETGAAGEAMARLVDGEHDSPT
ncbi:MULTISPECIES: FMN-binding negative transcriptional regulator [Derxia]|uniref:FMN-binding negative transcriptional regulator n=1 Tax=Derxia gummosa DSM 723 TaxID=1121388 RepID=A0A8B6X5R1_9BURK|nr:MULTISPECIES: FMN-binding negative transcriptional regulator [Derxia]